MSNIPGATNVLPGVFTDVVTDSRGTAVAGGNRVPAIMGEGLTEQVIVSSAVGKGKDGLNSSYTSTSNSDGRHFILQTFPVIQNRTQIFRNSVPLKGIEQKISGTDFSNSYDYRLDPETGKIELHKAFIEEVGGNDYVPFETNKGDGYISGLTLLDENAPNEVWSIRCVAVDRDSAGNPKPETARFIAVGSVSGTKLDTSGNKVEWKSNGQTFSNGILSFAIFQSSGTYFSTGDGFTVRVKSGQLSPNDSLTTKYIPTSFLNSPVALQGMDQVVNRFGYPSAENTLSLGAQLAFANGASSIVAVQCAPAVPRRTEIKLSDAVQADSLSDDDFVFALPLGSMPDGDANIQFFVTNNATGEESQILPNKQDFFTIGTGGTNPTFSDFINSTSTYSFYYSVVQNYNGDSTVASGVDGYILRDPTNGLKATLSSTSTSFTSQFINKIVKIEDADNAANNAEYVVTSVSNNKLYLEVKQDTYASWDTDSGLDFDILDVNGNVVVGYSGADGYFVKTTNSTGAFSSDSVTFSSSNLKLRINTAGSAQGVFDITGRDSLTDQLTIKKSVVTESDLTWSVLDSDLTSNYVVVNRYVVPNGYSLRVRIVDVKDANFYDAGWLNALDSLERTDVDIVVPLPKSTISVIMQNAMSHCRVMSNIRNRKERLLFTGAIRGLDPENLTGSSSDDTNTQAAVENIGVLEGIQGDDPLEVLNGNTEDLANYSVPDAFGGTYRCVYFYPDEIVVQAGADNIFVDGFYIAAAAAGWMAGTPRVEIPFTNKILSGFSILRNKQLSQTTLEALAGAGVCVLQPVSGGGTVKWGITTSQSGFAEEQEISVVFIRDRIAKSMRASFAGFIGQPETETTQIVLGNQAINVLNSFISQNLITQYANLTVQRDSVDPRQWNILVKVQPTYPINWIYIKVGVGTI